LDFRRITILKTKHLNVVSQDEQILYDIDFSVEPGTILSILGPNGAGKSTLLKALSGDIDFVKDKVQLEGKYLNDYSSKELADLRSVMPQSIHLDFPFLVSEVIEMSLLNANTVKERDSYVEQALALFDVTDLHDRNYLTLSGGEQQRVQLARVISQITLNKDNSPRYLFLDECTASLDLSHQHQVFDVVLEVVKKHNVAAIMVLHDLNLASQYSDELVLMKKGKIINQGTVKEVLTEQKISEVYNYPISIIQHPNGWPMVVPAYT